MNDEIREALEDMILTELVNLNTLGKIGSEERKDAIAGLEKLYRLYLDDEKLSIEDADSRDRMTAENEQRNLENYYREIQMAWERLDRKVRWGIEGSAIVLPLLFSAIWMRKGFKFEEEGTFTSDTFRWLRQKFKLTK